MPSDAANMPRLVRLPMQPPALMVLAPPHPCPYLPDRQARLRMREPLLSLSPDGLDWSFASGDRRQGHVLYAPQCSGCQACIPIRLDVLSFRPTASQKRAFRVGQQRLNVTIGPPTVDDERVALFNLHRTARGLDEGGEAVTAAGYRHFLVESCCDSLELAYRCKQTGKLLGIAVADKGTRALSAVYCHYDPTVAGLSIGVFSVLQQLELAKQWGMRWLYLGYYIRDCKAMRYKASYQPHELRDPDTGEWRLQRTQGS